MEYLIRIDPIVYNNNIVTKDNFIRNDILNRNIGGEPEIVCNSLCTCPVDCINSCCRYKTEPKNGFWLSVPTKDNTSCGWLDYIERMKTNLNDQEYNNEWSNLRCVRYKLKPSAKFLVVNHMKDIRDYIMTAPAGINLSNAKLIQLNNIDKLKKFLSDKKIDLTPTYLDSSTKGIIYSFDDDDNITIRKSKSGSNAQILASVNYLINECKKKLKKVQDKINDRITIDYDKLRRDGYDGLQLGDLKYLDDYRNNDIYETIHFFFTRFEPFTVVIWNWCFEDSHEVYFIDTR